MIDTQKGRRRNMDLVKELKENISPITVVENYLQIETHYRCGKRWCKCPIHRYNLGKEDERDTNCFVDEKGLTCFACQPNKIADIFEIVMKTQNCNFKESLNFLSSCSGISNNQTFSSKERFPFTKEEMSLIGFESKSFSFVKGFCEKYLGKEAPSNYLRKDNKYGIFHHYEIIARESVSVQNLFFNDKETFFELAKNLCEIKRNVIEKEFSGIEKEFYRNEIILLEKKIKNISHT